MLYWEGLLPRWVHVMPAVKLGHKQIGGLILTRPYPVILFGCTNPCDFETKWAL